MPYFPSSARAKDAEDVEEAEDDIGVPDQGDNHILPPPDISLVTLTLAQKSKGTYAACHGMAPPVDLMEDGVMLMLSQMMSMMNSKHRNH